MGPVFWLTLENIQTAKVEAIVTPAESQRSGECHCVIGSADVDDLHQVEVNGHFKWLEGVCRFWFRSLWDQRWIVLFKELRKAVTIDAGRVMQRMLVISRTQS